MVKAFTKWDVSRNCYTTWQGQGRIKGEATGAIAPGPPLKGGTP